MFKRITMAVLATSALVVATQAAAIDYPQGAPDDHRIKTVVYDPTETVLINAVAGLSVHIVLAPEEKYVTHVFGDGAAWAFAHVDNHYFIKTMAKHFADTNLVIVTNKHTYNILLHSISSYTTEGENGKPVKHLIHSPWTMKKATVQVKYKYPRAQRKEIARDMEAQRIENALQALGGDGLKNLRYRMSNEPDSRSIQPLNVWDNYRFTYFRFPRNAPLPTIFVIGPDGKETVANVSVAGQYNNILVAHTVAREWRVRYGKKVVGVVNDGYNPSLGASASGTISRDVERVIDVDKGENP